MHFSWEPVNPSCLPAPLEEMVDYINSSQMLLIFCTFSTLLLFWMCSPIFSWTFAEDHSARRHSVSSLNHCCLQLESIVQISSLVFCEWVKWHDTRSSWVYWVHGHNNHSHIPRHRHQFVLDQKILLIPSDTSTWITTTIRWWRWIRSMTHTPQFWHCQLYLLIKSLACDPFHGPWNCSNIFPNRWRNLWVWVDFLRRNVM